MIKKNYFAFEDAPGHANKSMIRPIFENFPEGSMVIGEDGGSFGVLCARLLNLSYPQYLRFCRDVIGADVSGKHHLYPTVVFDKNDKARELVNLLNARMRTVIWEREHPDWREHAEYAKKKEEDAARRAANVPN